MATDNSALFDINALLASYSQPGDNIDNTLLTNQDNGIFSYAAGTQLPTLYDSPAVFQPPIASNQVGTTNAGNISNGSSILDQLTMAGRRIVSSVTDAAVGNIQAASAANQQQVLHVAPGSQKVVNYAQSNALKLSPVTLLLLAGAAYFLFKK